MLSQEARELAREVDAAFEALPDDARSALAREPFYRVATAAFLDELVELSRHPGPRIRRAARFRAWLLIGCAPPSHTQGHANLQDPADPRTGLTCSDAPVRTKTLKLRGSREA